MVPRIHDSQVPSGDQTWNPSAWGLPTCEYSINECLRSPCWVLGAPRALRTQTGETGTLLWARAVWKRCEHQISRQKRAIMDASGSTQLGGIREASRSRGPGLITPRGREAQPSGEWHE